MSWNDASVETLKLMWAAGATASEIANELGGVSRNGVLSKVHRLGISERTKGRKQGYRFLRGEKAQPREPRPPRPKLARSGARQDERKRLPAGNLPPLPIDQVVDSAADLEIPMDQRKTLTALERGHCKWPCGDPRTPQFFFCGAPQEGDGPYCAPHRLRSLPGPSDRRVGAPFRMIRHR